MKTNRPFVLINMAMSADGKIAPAHRRFVAFGSRCDHANLLALRATTDGVMCGARTVDSAPVTLDAGGTVYELRRLRGAAAPSAAQRAARTPPSAVTCSDLAEIH